MKTNELLYNKFSTNLHHISRFLKFDFEKRFQEEGYICPLSFKIHTKESLSNKYDDQLTIEHIPPEALNGKALCLTNRISNSEAGHSLDLALQNQIKMREFHEGISGLSTKVYIENVKMDGYIDFTDKENPKFTFGNKKWHKGNEKVEKLILSKKKFDFKFIYPKEDRKFLLSLLRTAYLYAFGHLGYSIIFGLSKLTNPNYDLIRKQIQNPDKPIVNDIVFVDNNLEDINLGLNIVFEPKEFRCLFVVFEAETEKKKWRYGVFLPGPDDYGFTAISNLKTTVSDKKMLNFKYSNFPKIDITDFSSSILYYKD